MKKKIIYIIVAVILISIVIYIKPDIKPSVGVEKVKDLELVNSRKTNEKSKFLIFKDKLVSWDNGDLRIENEEKEKGKENDEKEYLLNLNVEDPIFRPGENYLYVANKQSGVIYFVDEKAEMVERIDLARGIFDIDLKSKHLLYHAKDGNGETVGIINTKGQNIMKYDYKQGQILTYELNASKKKCLVATLEIGKDTMGSKLHIYDNLKNEEEVYFKEEIIIDITTMKFDNVMILTDNKIYYLSGTEIVWEKEVDLLKDYQIIGDNIYLMSGNSLKIIDTKGEMKKEVKFEGKYNKFIIDKNGFFKEQYIFYNKEGLAIYNPEKVLEKQLPIKDIFILDDTILVLDNEKLGEYSIIERKIELEDEE